IGYFKEANALTYKAELSAARAAQYIYAPDAPWKYDTDPLAAMSEIRTTTAAPIVQRILDACGAIMMQKGDLLPWPTFARQAPIFAAGAKVGMAEVSASLRPLLTEVASVGFGALVLAVAAYFAFTLLPLGALDRWRSSRPRTTSSDARTFSSIRRSRTWFRGWRCSTP